MFNFDFTKDYTLEDEQVLLRPLVYSDLENLVAFAINEPEIWKYSLLKIDGEESLRKYIELAIKAREEKKEYPFIVFDKRFQKYAGSTRYYDIQLDNQTLQLGYTWYGQNFQGTGLNKHCKLLLLDFAFNQMDMIRVEFRADNKNDRSIAAMKSIGCTVEGVMRSNLPTPAGTRRDSIVLSILKSEWEDHVQELIKSKL
jgi:RimJ/RimL family protein N-acetyltransferase